MVRTLKRIEDQGAEARCLALSPRPLIAIETKQSEIDVIMGDAEFLAYTFADLLLDIADRVQRRRDHYPCLFRCVSFERLPVILATGCDVEPSDSVLHAADFGYKAPEYGGDDKVMLLFDGWALDKCVQHVPRDIAPDELERLQRLYPYEEESHTEMRTLRRVPLNQSLNNFYSMWIPGDPWEALLAVFVVGRSNSSILAASVKHIQECMAVRWTLDCGTGTG